MFLLQCHLLAKRQSKQRLWIVNKGELIFVNFFNVHQNEDIEVELCFGKWFGTFTAHKKVKMIECSSVNSDTYVKIN